MTPQIEEKLVLLPDKPGVYLMKNSAGRTIYVGKAINLKNRVRSYFQSSRNHSAKTLALVAKITDLEYIVTNTEIEALILECNLIKRHRPKYNISLKDDKSYPYIKLTTNEEFPRVYITRRIVKDGARYFGPYTSAGAVHETLKLLKSLFPLRSCRQLKAARPCLEYHIKRCLAPCADQSVKVIYDEMIQAVTLFLEGRSDSLIKKTRQNMLTAADNLEFEQAARLRNQLSALEKITEKQNIVTGGGDQDVLGLARAAAGICMQVFFIRSGKIVGRDHFFLKGGETEENEAILSAFIKQYYSQAAFIPREILLPYPLSEKDLLKDWLTTQKGGSVFLNTPQRGAKKDLIHLAAENAATVLAEQGARLQADEQEKVNALNELASYLELKKAPERIECFDISHIQGAETVASMVVFENGEPNKNEYRRYKLTSTEGKPDDFKSMQEVTAKRYHNSDKPIPDLIIIDGGKGQLSSALPDIRAVTDTPVISIAKQFEHIFREGSSEPLILPPYSQSLYLLKRIRDEAHRFAITYHRKLRSKRNLVSILDHVTGIGPKRRKALWDHFGSLTKIKAASLEELALVKGMTQSAAAAVREFFEEG
ncbi:MAG: excinuclease ABC subunit UvrC [Sporomusaceae bacterium]|jgi:excinuclease ABC subunit C|nr:excinuclease ABC subunit UvrC [Sporomusaceae bacterium]